MFVTTTTIVNTGLSAPLWLAFDSQGNLYCTNNTTNRGITKTTFDLNGNVVSTIQIVTGILLRGITFNSLGELYYANQQTNTINKIVFNSDGTVQSTTIFVSINKPVGLIFDGNNNLYCSTLDNNIVKINPLGTITLFVNSLSSPSGLAFDSSGNLYCCNEGSNRITKTIVNQDGSAGSTTNFFTTSSLPVGIIFDSSGNLYCSLLFDNKILKITIVDSIVTGSSNYVTGLQRPVGIVFDSQENLYCANLSNNSITKSVFSTEIPNTITVNSLFVKTFGDAPFDLNATSLNTNYGLQPLTYVSSNSLIASVDENGLVTINDEDTSCTITINQVAGSGYGSATGTTTIQVNKNTLTNPTNITNEYDLDYFVGTTATYGLIMNDITVTINNNLVSNGPKVLLSNELVVLTKVHTI